MKSVTSLNNIALEEIKQKQERLKPTTALVKGSPKSSSRNNSYTSFNDTNSSLTTISPSSGGGGGGGHAGGNMPHICPRCEKAYTYKKNLSRHLRFECGILPQEKCPYCDYLTRYKHSLNVHVRTQHPEYYNTQKSNKA